MASVTMPSALGGSGATYTDDSDPSTGLANGGHRTRLVPMLADAVAMAESAADSAVLAQRRNVLINSSFEVWNEATAATSSATQAWRAECWYVTASGAAVTSERSTTVRTSNRARYSIQLNGAASVTTVQLGHRIESCDVPKIAGTVTFQAWVYNGSGASFQPSLLVYTAGSIDSWGAPTARLTQTLQSCADAAWTQVSHTVDISGYTNLANGVTIELRIPSGSMVAGDTVRIMEPMLCLAGQVASFEVEPVPETERRCERFFEKSFSRGTAPAQNAGGGLGELVWPASLAGTSVNRSQTVIFRTPKRTTPTMTGYNPNAANAQARDIFTPADCTSTTFTSNAEVGFRVTATGAAGTSIGNPISLHWTANARLA
jgi:hypothetical protein